MSKKKYFTDEERKAAQKTKSAKYKSTLKGRANNLLYGYRREDKKYNRGNCTLTADWIVNNIFTQPCVHCGETDWRKLGCNRLDNSLPHIPENVESCCFSCNYKLYNPKKTVYQYTLDGLLVAIWPSVNECSKNGYDPSTVAKCCNGKLKTHKGYRWSYKPLNF